jgi:AraC-like DNA-binding protein
MEFTLNDDLYYERPPGNREFYTLRSREANVSSSLVTEIDHETIQEPQGIHKSLFLTSSFFDFSIIVSKGSHLSSIQIELTKEWMATYLHMNVYDDILHEYLRLKIKMLDAVIMDADYSATQQEILSINRNHPAERTILQNRLMHIIERFFTELYEHRKQLKYKIRKSSADIDTIIRIEADITSETGKEFPSIHVLAKKYGMSPSKLKALFKKIYGKPIYQYHLEWRMQKAKVMLLSGNHSVKETALEAGFKNMSNFSLAFKKQFNALPKDMIRRGK